MTTLMRSMGLNPEGFDIFMERLSLAQSIQDPVNRSGGRQLQAAVALTASFLTFSASMQSALALPASAFPGFDASVAISVLDAQVTTAHRNAQEAADNPGMSQFAQLVGNFPGGSAALMQALTNGAAGGNGRGNGRGNGAAAPAASADDYDGGSGGEPHTKSQKTTFYELLPFGEDKYVRRYPSQGSITHVVWRDGRSGATDAWKVAVVLRWQKESGHTQGLGNGVTLPRLDAILSSQTTADKRAANARDGQRRSDAPAAQTKEPNGWMQMRDTYRDPDFRLPVAN